MTEYSGKTTDHHPLRSDDWKDGKDGKGGESECIKTETVFDVQWSNCPIEVEDEVRHLWRDYEYGNDHYYFKWDSEENSEYYPIIDEFLKSKDVTKCLIHWWW